MKNYLNVTLAIIFMAISLHAQHMNIGIKAGLNLYNISSTDNSANDSKLGFHFGLIGHTHLADQLALQPEIVYSTQGAKFTAGGIDYKTNLGYLNIPILLQYMFDNGFRIEAGPQFGILISAKSENNDSDSDIKSNFQTLDFSLGIGLSYVKPSTGFGVDVRYNLGLSNINENSSVKSTNIGFQIGVFYLLDHH